MQDDSIFKNKQRFHFGVFMLLFICGLLVFFINMTFTNVIPLKIGILVKILLIIIFLALAILLHRNKRLNKYWKAFYAFFVVAATAFLSLSLSKLGLRVFNVEMNTLKGITVYKLLEDLLIIFSIIVLIKIAKDNMSSIYIAKGNLRLGLIIGLASFFGLFLLSFLLTTQNISSAKFISLTPSLLIIALADGFMEELLFRGVFLKKFEPFMGATVANLLTALIYSLAHLQVSFTSSLPVFLSVTFLFGLLWGYIMKKTQSILAPALFHAGVDMLIVIDFLASLGIT